MAELSVFYFAGVKGKRISQKGYEINSLANKRFNICRPNTNHGKTMRLTIQFLGRWISKSEWKEVLARELVSVKIVKSLRTHGFLKIMVLFKLLNYILFCSCVL